MNDSPRAAARRESLIRLGRGLFAERAYDEVTTSLLAEKGDISLGLLYRYFGDKRGFYLACLKDAARELLELLAIEGDFARRGPRPVLQRFLDVVEREPAFFRGVLRGGVGADPEAWAIVQAAREQIAERLLAAAGLTAPGVAAAPPLRLAVHAWLGAIEAATLYWLDGGGVGRHDVEALAVHSLPLFLAPAALETK